MFASISVCASWENIVSITRFYIVTNDCALFAQDQLFGETVTSCFDTGQRLYPPAAVGTLYSENTVLNFMRQFIIYAPFMLYSYKSFASRVVQNSSSAADNKTIDGLIS